MSLRGWIGSLVLLAALATGGLSLATWKAGAVDAANAAAENPPEPVEFVTLARARSVRHTETTTAIGTVLALRSITLRNELPGTVRDVMLTPGEIVEEGTVLVALDVSVERAELEAQLAEAELAETILDRIRRLSLESAVPELDVHRAVAERDVRLAEIERTRAIIERKTIRAPFPARVGIADVHPGQYLNEGTELTTLQGIDAAAHVDFAVAQQVADGLSEGDRVRVFTSEDGAPIGATIVALDARIDPVTRNAIVRARVTGSRGGTAEGGGPDGKGRQPGGAAGAVGLPAPGASVRVEVPVGPRRTALAVPVSALRKGPGGDHVFVIAADEQGATRAYERLVDTGPMVGDEILIYAGLEAGENVASVGSFKLREGVRVEVTQPDTPVAE